MPTYAYACTQCGHRFDAVQAFSESSLTECPECGGVLRKQYGSIGVTFNGSGFYRTDSRAGAGAGGKAGSSSSGDSGGGSSASSTSSKSEAPASPAPAGS
ncbi:MULTISPECIES: FmdB family zinc ribbon protein [unclassified Microbacterium]|uniref:FmdB family zinc ribbon protein n=1 Tax=unclassified Microbacterium TaxID=2609290 RepID=UPI0038657B68